jgi:hypothetical protein
MSTLAKWTRPALALIGTVSVLVLFSGCKAEECQQMIECCAAVSDVPGVGSSCGELAEQTRDPDTCRTILKTVRYMYEERTEEPPEICLPKKKGESSSRLDDEREQPREWSCAEREGDLV